ncbi:MAG: tRNA dihydrouridine synthase [Candidatus Levyibacteriota bacterium]
MTNIWQKLAKPFFVQAPMEDVTDSVFRQIIGKVGKPDLYFTEFTHVDGITKGSEEYIRQRLYFTPTERPLIAQIWGNNPESVSKAVSILRKSGYDGIDINMGCPVREVIKQGCGSALINNPSLAKDIFNAAVSSAEGLPVSIKTRIGFREIQTEEWMGFLLGLKPAALTVHARTAKEMSKVPAHWEEFGKVVNLKNNISAETIVVANGDIQDRKQGRQVYEKYGVDGIMIGRGMLVNPGVFSTSQKEIGVKKRLELLKEHILLFDKTWGKTSAKGRSASGGKNFEIMKKFYKAYIHGFENAAELRLSLMPYKTSEDTLKVLEKLIETNRD